jgi:hypothetical protein
MVPRRTTLNPQLAAGKEGLLFAVNSILGFNIFKSTISAKTVMSSRVDF